jgi:hypothetical protein
MLSRAIRSGSGVAVFSDGRNAPKAATRHPNGCCVGVTTRQSPDHQQQLYQALLPTTRSCERTFVQHGSRVTAVHEGGEGDGEAENTSHYGRGRLVLWLRVTVSAAFTPRVDLL